MTLALATGIGQAEVATVRRDEVLLRANHLHAEDLHLTTSEYGRSTRCERNGGELDPQGTPRPARPSATSTPAAA